MRMPEIIMRKYYTQVFMWDDFCYLMISHIYIGGWYGLFNFLETVNDSDFKGLNLTNQLSAQESIFCISELRTCCCRQQIFYYNI